MLKSLISPKFWLNVLAIILFLIILLLGTLYALKVYTKHGETITVPDFEGLQVGDQLDRFIENKPLQYTISDSTYVADKPSGAVLNQSPLPNEKVKRNRRIYLTINRETAPMTVMPNLYSTSIKNAERQLENSGLVLGEVTYTPCLGKKTVHEVFVNKSLIKQGANIRKGTKVDLVLCDGFGNKSIDVPNLVGFSYSEAATSVRLSELTVGSVNLDDDLDDKVNGFVYKQVPPPILGNTIRIGEPVDVWLQKDPVVIPDDFFDMEEEKIDSNQVIDFNKLVRDKENAGATKQAIEEEREEIDFNKLLEERSKMKEEVKDSVGKRERFIPDLPEEDENSEEEPN